MTNGGSVYSYKQAIKKGERRLSESYTAMGIRAYNLVRQGEVASPELEEVAHEIDAIAMEINSYKGAIEGITTAREVARGLRCPHCGTTAAPGTKFCPGCGQQLALPATPAPANTVVCPSCGGRTDIDSKFCVLCGVDVRELASQQTLAQAEQVGQSCPHCGDPLEEDAVFCVSCGKTVAAAAETAEKGEAVAEGQPVRQQASTHVEQDNELCPHCGELLEEGAAFCVSCGKNMVD